MLMLEVSCACVYQNRRTHKQTDAQADGRTKNQQSDNYVSLFGKQETAPSPYLKEQDVRQVGLRKIYMTHFDEGGTSARVTWLIYAQNAVQKYMYNKHSDIIY